MPDDEQATDSSSGRVTLDWPHSLYLCVGAVAVLGARVEGALVRLLRHLDPQRLTEPHKEVTWQETEEAIRKAVGNVDPQLAASVIEALDWAVKHDLRARRNRSVHDQYPLLPGDGGVFITRIARKQQAVTVVGAHAQLLTQLQETADLLLALASRLEEITSWVSRPSRRLLPLMPPSWPAGT